MPRWLKRPNSISCMCPAASDRKPGWKMTNCWIGYSGRRRARGTSFLFAQVLSFAARLVCSRATTHWSAFHLLRYFGAVPVDERVVMDGNLVCAAGVTAGIDGALRVAAELRGDEAAQIIQLQMQYAPEPPFHSGTPKTAPTTVLEKSRQAVRAMTERRQKTAERVARRLGIALTSAEMP
jgi:cyclohexyl-isocyanide hydratase